MNPEKEFVGIGSRFELYSIEFVELAPERKDLKSIQIYSRFLHTLYSRDDDEEVPIGKPIRLSIPRRSIADPLYDPIDFEFGNPDWLWQFQLLAWKDRKVGEVLRRRIKDPDTNSYALITYEVIRNGIDAGFKFQFQEQPQQRPEGFKIKIIKGSISVITNKDWNTRRVLKAFNFLKIPVVVDPGDEIELTRPVVATPLNARLDVVVCLFYCFEGKEEEEGTIQENHTFYAPKSPNKETKVYCGTLGDLKMNLEVDWIDSELL